MCKRNFLTESKKKKTQNNERAKKENEWMDPIGLDWLGTEIQLGKGNVLENQFFCTAEFWYHISIFEFYRWRNAKMFFFYTTKNFNSPTLFQISGFHFQMVQWHWKLKAKKLFFLCDVMWCIGCWLFVAYLMGFEVWNVDHHTNHNRQSIHTDTEQSNRFQTPIDK